MSGSDQMHGGDGSADLTSVPATLAMIAIH